MKVALAREMIEEHRSAPSSSNGLPVTNAVRQGNVQFAIKTILVPTDFSPLAAKALAYAHRFAGQFGAELILLHVTEPVTYAPAHCPVDSVDELRATHRKAAEEALAEFSREILASPAARAVIYRPMVVEGDAAHETDRVARECKADLIVIATHGYTGINHLLLGGTTEKVVRRAPCPVLVVREKERDFVPSVSSLETAGEEGTGHLQASLTARVERRLC